MKTIWFAFVLIAAAPGVAVAQTMVSTCNTTFSGAGILTQDLVCAGTAAAVVVETSGSLDMNGFTITARTPSLAGQPSLVGSSPAARQARSSRLAEGSTE